VKVTFLGTSAGAPTRKRNVTSIALQLDQQSCLWLFDCGEGTQHQFLRSPLRLSQLERIFITHLHGDHLFGLVGLLASRSLQDGIESPVTLYGPEGIVEYVRACLDVGRTRLQFPLHIEVVRAGVVCETETTQVLCAPMQHGIPAFGYAVQERVQTGRFDVDQARALGVPEGPLFGRLKKGEQVALEDGRVIDGRTLVGGDRPGRRFVFCGDTTFTPNAIQLAQDADMLVHEATYIDADRPLALRANHSTSLMAAEVARRARAQMLVLTHFSARYEAEGSVGLPALLAEAQAVFPNTYLAHDFWTHSIPRREPVPKA
jgi:ribonuclease Z